MTAQTARLPDYLSHILQAIENIECYTQDLDEVAFLDNKLVQDAVIRNLEIIGEASHNIERADPAFAESHPDIPLAFAWEMRNALSHGYFKVDAEIVWKTIELDLPELTTQIRRAANNL